jgi:hypothetical protein
MTDDTTTTTITATTIKPATTTLIITSEAGVYRVWSLESGWLKFRLRD